MERRFGSNQSQNPEIRVIYSNLQAEFKFVCAPKRPERANFVIMSHYGQHDWSGFRTLAECEAQFSELIGYGRPNGYYVVVEK